MNQKVCRRGKIGLGMLLLSALCMTACANPKENPQSNPTPTAVTEEMPTPTDIIVPTPLPTATTVPTPTEMPVVEMSQFMDGFLPMEIMETLSVDCWGAAEVGARDQGNGLEDRVLSDYSYWDGGILKDDETGKYYMFASRWNQAGGHWGENGIQGWQGSQAIYAVSENLYGPYEDMGPIWPDWCEGAGHNVFPFKLSEKDALYGTYKYGIVISDTGMHGEIANGTIHVSSGLNGPWELLGKVTVEGGEFSLSNISILVRPDGTYEAINRNGDIVVADTIAGPWKSVETRLWWKVEGMSSVNVEDPVIWYADGLYHCIANKWDARRAYYLTSEDGITNWELHPGTAYTPDADFLRYEDGTINNWKKIERPNVYIEDGTLKAMTFAVIDVQKEVDFGNDSHGSKIVVVPFSGKSLKTFANQENPLKNRAGIVAAEDTNIQSWGDESKKNYGGESFMQVQKDGNWNTHGMGILGEGERPDEWYDSKVAYLKFDLSGYDLANKKVKSAYLSLVYLYQVSGNAKENSVQVALADPSWVGGEGSSEKNNNGCKRGWMNWARQAAVLEYGSVVSETFSTEQGSVELKIDVTELVEAFRTAGMEGNLISFAFNETGTGNRLCFASSESGETYAPKLQIEWE